MNYQSFMLALCMLVYFAIRECVLTENSNFPCQELASRRYYFRCVTYLAVLFRQYFAYNIRHNHSPPHKCSCRTVPKSASAALICSLVLALLVCPAGIWLQLVYPEDHTTEYTWSISWKMVDRHSLATLCKSS